MYVFVYVYMSDLEQETDAIFTVIGRGGKHD